MVVPASPPVSVEPTAAPLPLRVRAKNAIGVLRHVPPTFGLMWRAAPAHAVAFGMLSALQALIPAAVAWLAKLITDAVVHSAATHDAAGMQRVLTLVGIEAALMIGQAALGRGTWLVQEVIGARLKRSLAERVLDKALTLELRHFEDSSIYDKMQNARREADVRPLHLVTEAVGALKGAVSLLSYGALLLSIAPWCLPVLLLAAVPSFIAELRFANEGYRIISWRAPDGRRLNYLEWVLTRDSTVKEVKLFGLGSLILGRYFALYDKTIAQDRKLARRRALWGTLLGMVSLAAFYACYAYVAQRAARGDVSLGDLALSLAVFHQGQDAFARILQAVGSIYEDALFMSNLFVFLNIDVTEEARRRTGLVPFPKGHAHTLEIDHVSFKYPAPDSPPDPNAPPKAAKTKRGAAEAKDPDRFILKDISLVVKPGEKIALVGENGAGKSTIVKLLLGLYEPTSGAIRYGGVDIRSLDPAELRARFSALFQDFVRYQLPAKENVGVGDLRALDDTARLDQAAEKGGAGKVIAGLPHQWETLLGSWFEDGSELSGGQWQKLALARAFLRDDAEVLILDEPSSAIDARAEQELFDRLRKLAEGKIAFLISHRFSTVRMADRIVVLDNGSIKELGSHDELVALGGTYAQLFALQAQAYR